MANPPIEAACTEQLPSITEAFSGYTPRDDVNVMVQRMLASVPAKYLVGLDEVVLTNIDALPRSRRRGVTKSRGKKIQFTRAKGLYHPAFGNRTAWIEIFVDNTMRRWESRWLPLGWLREMELSDVLFHEIGHHIHYTVRPEFREREDVADVWKVRLETNYRRSGHAWLRKFLRFTLIRPLFRRAHAKAMSWGFKKGYMSRAEYEESLRIQTSNDRRNLL